MPAFSTPLLGLTLAASLGLAAGLGGFAFFFAEGHSYLTDDPAACGNCHVMDGHLTAWRQGSHHEVAVCNDCHTPSGAAKYLVKAENGWHHSVAFTLGEHPENIRAREQSLQVVEQRCRECHADLVSRMTAGNEGVSCLRCHRGVGHLR